MDIFCMPCCDPGTGVKKPTGTAVGFFALIGLDTCFSGGTKYQGIIPCDSRHARAE